MRVDGRPLPVRTAGGYLILDLAAQQESEIEQRPDPSRGFAGDPERALMMVFAGQFVESTRSTIAVDQWVASVDRRETFDDFSDDSFWFGGQHIGADGSGGDVVQEFVAFDPSCRRNPQLGLVSLARATEDRAGSGLSWLVFAPECRGDGFVMLSLSENVLSSGRRVELDLLGPG